MKELLFKIALLIVLLLPVVGHAQFTDDFSDGNFTANPAWNGDDTIFDASANDLHLNAAPISSQAYMSTPNQAIENASWEFLVQLDFNPSSSNLARVYLVSDQANLRGALNGYFVEVGGSTDEVSLYRQDGSSDAEIIDGLDGILNTSTVSVRIRVTRDATGNWELFSDAAGGTNFTSEGTVFDDTYIQSLFSGVFCLYTATRSDKFGFDDFIVTGTPFTDTVPPAINTLNVISTTELDVLFSEPMQQTGAEVEANYVADNGLGSPTSAVLDGSNPALVHLTFATAFQNGVTNTLQVFNVQDLAGNSIGTDSETFVYFVPDTPDPKDVIITELMPDPTPVVGLPDGEYVEIHNRSNKFFNLDGWILTDGSSFATLRARPLAPGGYLIIVANGDSATFQNNVTANTMGVSNMPSLNNAADLITLMRPVDSLIIDQVNYTDDWYQNANKDGGGWSLELINPDIPCTTPFNWIASENVDGGTPGNQNSVYDVTADTQAPELLSAQVVSADTLLLIFDEPLDTLSAQNGTYTVDNGLIVISAIPVAPNYDRVYLVVTPSMTMGTLYTLTVSGITDCSGNATATASEVFALPELPAAGDVIINEVLYDPVTGGSDFVEIYNNSEKVLSLQGWAFANYDDDTIANFKTITNEPILFFPGTYYLCTEDKDATILQYPNTIADRVIEMDLPTYSNDSATVYLINSLDTVSDAFSYDDDMQFSLLNSSDGVSLERIDFDRPTNDASNWHSAAENVGFATPGFENSQYYPGMLPDDAITLDPAIFSPDNDGYQDVLNINYKMDGPGYVGSITIYDQRGRLVRTFLQNELLATEGIYSWDGTNDNGEKARIGTYVILFEVFTTGGTTNTFKKVAVLGGRL